MRKKTQFKALEYKFPVSESKRHWKAPLLPWSLWDPHYQQNQHTDGTFYFILGIAYFWAAAEMLYSLKVGAGGKG